MPYVLIVAGLLMMCVPEEASLLRFILQGGLGLSMLGLGVFITLDENNS